MILFEALMSIKALFNLSSKYKLFNLFTCFLRILAESILKLIIVKQMSNKLTIPISMYKYHWF